MDTLVRPESRALAATLKDERRSAGVSFKELERRSGVAKSSLLRYEQGTRTPTFDVMVAIAEALGTSASGLALAAERRASSSLHDTLRSLVAAGHTFDDLVLPERSPHREVDLL